MTQSHISDIQKKAEKIVETRIAANQAIKDAKDAQADFDSYLKQLVQQQSADAPTPAAQPTPITATPVAPASGVTPAWLAQR